MGGCISFSPPASYAHSYPPSMTFLEDGGRASVRMVRNEENEEGKICSEYFVTIRSSICEERMVRGKIVDKRRFVPAHSSGIFNLLVVLFPTGVAQKHRDNIKDTIDSHLDREDESNGERDEEG